VFFGISHIDNRWLAEVEGVPGFPWKCSCPLTKSYDLMAFSAGGE
jgi:hypothetical protein